MPTFFSDPPHRAARPRSAREQRWRGAPRTLVFVLAALAVVAIAVSAIVGSIGGGAAAPSAAGERGGLTIGAAASTGDVGSVPGAPGRIEIHLDYTDPAAARFASVNALVVQGYVQQGRAEVALYPLAIAEPGTERDAAVRVGNAVACVGEHDGASLWEFSLALLALQPATGQDALDDADLSSLARDATVSNLEQVDACIAESRYGSWIVEESDEALANGVGDAHVGVTDGPVVLVEGAAYEGRVDSSEQFREFLEVQLTR